MNSSRTALKQASEEPGEKRSSVRRTISPGHTKEGNIETQAKLQSRFSDCIHAQVTKVVFEQDLTAAAVLDLNGRIQLANQALARLLGYSLNELVGKVFEEFVHDIKESEDLRPPKASGRSMPILANRLARKSGEIIECLVDSRVICDDSGKPVGFLVFVADTQAKKDAEARGHLESKLHRSMALQTLGTLAGGIAHDFNNTLEVILGFASLARIRLAPTDPLHEPLKIIEESAKKAASLVRQLLDVSRTNPVGKETIDVSELIGAVLTIITRTFDRKIQIEHQTAPNLPFIKGFRSRLEQAILNLCINARDAMPGGGTLTIEATSQILNRNDLRLPDSNTPGPYVRIAVRDSGTGMTAEVIDQIFVPLFTTKKPRQGSGLGLAMVDRAIKEEQGFVSVNSKPGEGSEFALYLPVLFTERPHTVKDGPIQLISGRGTVLVVDDEPRVLEFLQKGLSRLGYKVIPAESGTQACEMYTGQFEHIDCVLLDMIMPGMSGLDTCARLQKINPGVRVILSSGYSSGRTKREAVESGSVEFLEKPYTLEALSQALRKVQRN